MPSDGLVIRARKPVFVAIAPALFAVAGGAAGFIDTDVSATTGTNTQRVWLVMCFTDNDTGQGKGARPHGSAVATNVVCFTLTTFSTVDSSGHMDLYRDAFNNNYYLLGYLE